MPTNKRKKQLKRLADANRKRRAAEPSGGNKPTKKKKDKSLPAGWTAAPGGDGRVRPPSSFVKVMQMFKGTNRQLFNKRFSYYADKFTTASCAVKMQKVYGTWNPTLDNLTSTDLRTRTDAHGALHAAKSVAQAGIQDDKREIQPVVGLSSTQVNHVGGGRTKRSSPPPPASPVLPRPPALQLPSSPVFAVTAHLTNAIATAQAEHNTKTSCLGV